MKVSTSVNFTAIPATKKNFHKKSLPKDIISFGNTDVYESEYKPGKKPSFLDKVRKLGLPLALATSLGIGAHNCNENAHLRETNARLAAALDQTGSELSALKQFVTIDQSREIAALNTKMPVDLKETVKECIPAAVTIKGVDGVGSGVFIKDVNGDLYILSAAHVVDTPIKDKKDEYFNVLLYSGSDKQEPATVKARVLKNDKGAKVLDSNLDLVLLKVDAKDSLPSSIIPIELRDLSKEPLQYGESVIAIGSPMGLKESVSMGTVSNPERILNKTSNVVLVQTDAVINSGNSGGMMVDAQGRLVGVNEAMLRMTPLGDGNGIGFATRVDQVFDFLKANNIEAN